MNYEPAKEEIDLIRYLLDDVGGNGFWTDMAVAEALRLTKIFHYLSAIKVLKIKDGEEIKLPELDEINEKLEKLLEDKGAIFGQ